MPCPNYSRSGNHTGYSGKTGWMYVEQTEVILKLLPKAIRPEMSDFVAKAPRTYDEQFAYISSQDEVLAAYDARTNATDSEITASCKDKIVSGEALVLKVNSMGATQKAVCIQRLARSRR